MKGKKTGSGGRKHFCADPRKAAAARASRQAAVRLGDGEAQRPKGSFSSQNRRAPVAAGETDKAARPRKALPAMAAPQPAAAPVAPPVNTTSVQTVTVTPDENGMRVDRFLEARFPGLSFSHIQRIVRKGELRVNSKRVETKDRLEAGQAVRIPPLHLEEQPDWRPGARSGWGWVVGHWDTPDST